MKKLFLILSLLATPGAFGQGPGNLSPENVGIYLSKYPVIVCEIEKESVSIQIQFVGDRKDWVVWFMGRERGAQAILEANVTPLESFQNQFHLTLENGAKIFLSLAQGEGTGSGTFEIRSREYDLIGCAPKF